MEWFLYLIGTLWLVLGTLIVLYTDVAMGLINGLVECGNWKIIGLTPLTSGVLLIISAWWSDFFWTILALGVLATLKGLFFLFAPTDTIEKWVGFWCERANEVVYRLNGLLVVIFGIFLIYAA